MATTHIDTNTIPRVRNGSQGEMAEILNKDLCGAENVVGTLRWLGAGDSFATEALADTHQLLYLMEGEGVIELGDKPYDVGKGAGVYLEPLETATIRQAGDRRLKLFHLVVPIKHDQ